MGECPEGLFNMNRPLGPKQELNPHIFYSTGWQLSYCRKLATTYENVIIINSVNIMCYKSLQFLLWKVDWVAFYRLTWLQCSAIDSTRIGLHDSTRMQIDRLDRLTRSIPGSSNDAQHWSSVSSHQSESFANIQEVLKDNETPAIAAPFVFGIPAIVLK